MSLEEIKSRVSTMPENQQDELAAYLVHLRHQRDPQISRDIRANIENNDPKQWVSLDELKEKWKD